MQVSTNRPMSAAEWAMLVALSVLWGGSFFFTGIALAELPVFTLVAARVALGALVLNLVVPALGGRMPNDARTWLAFFGMGLLNNALPFCLIVWGQTHIASGLAAILNATTPLWGVIVAHLFTSDERLTGPRLAGVLLGLAGVVVMIGPTLLAGLGSNVLAQLAVAAAALSYAVAGVFGRRFRRMGIAPLASAAGQVSASTVLLVPLALVVDHPWTLPVPSAPVLGAVLGIAVLSTALAYVLFFRVLASAGATNIMLVTLLVPVSAILLGSLVLGEPLEPRQLTGMGLIGLGLAAIDGRLIAGARAGFARLRENRAA
jgi:drug/metabolite transporter (DMT)-like permease